MTEWSQSSADAARQAFASYMEGWRRGARDKPPAPDRAEDTVYAVGHSNGIRALRSAASDALAQLGLSKESISTADGSVEISGLDPTETIEATLSRRARHTSVSPEDALAQLNGVEKGDLRR